MDDINFAKYGKPFQECLAALIFKDNKFASQIEEVLNLNYFELRYLQTFVKLTYDYKEKYGKFPSDLTMASILKAELDVNNAVIKKQLKDFFAKIKSENIGNVDPEFVKTHAIDFCKKQKLKEAMIKSVELVQNSSFDEISKIINEALKAGTTADIGHDFVNDFEDRYKLTARNPISTGWDIVDSYLRGGHGEGELGVVIAGTGVGKSQMLTHLGAHALKAGKNVVHYTLELSDKVIGLRYDSCLTGTPINNLSFIKEEIFENIKQIPGKLIIKEYPGKSASVNTLKNHLKKMEEQDFKINMVIVDYGDLLKSTEVRKETWHQLETIYQELRTLAQEFKIPCWTASQSNRGSSNAEVVTMDAISDAYSKCFKADFVFSLSRTIQDKTNNTGRIFIAKNRNGEDGIICPIFMDAGKVQIKVFEPTDESIEDLKKKSLKQHKEDLKKKYANWTDNSEKKEIKKFQLTKKETNKNGSS
jgi:hypothetical protein